MACRDKQQRISFACYTLSRLRTSWIRRECCRDLFTRCGIIAKALISQGTTSQEVSSQMCFMWRQVKLKRHFCILISSKWSESYCSLSITRKKERCNLSTRSEGWFQQESDYLTSFTMVIAGKTSS